MRIELFASFIILRWLETTTSGIETLFMFFFSDNCCFWSSNSIFYFLESLRKTSVPIQLLSVSPWFWPLILAGVDCKELNCYSATDSECFDDSATLCCSKMVFIPSDCYTLRDSCGSIVNAYSRLITSIPLSTALKSNWAALLLKRLLLAHSG